MGRMNGISVLLGALLLGLPATSAAFEPVQLPAAPVVISALWQPAAQGGRRPAIIALHGCGGLFDSRGRVAQRYHDYAARFNAAGWHLLAPDSFTARGEQSICSQRAGQRTIDASLRRADVQAALDWLSQRADVDPARIALIGWSHGGMTLLEAVSTSLDPVPVAAVAFYPGCRSARKRQLTPAVPMLMLLGESDDWTPAVRCIDYADDLQRRQPGVALHVLTYAGGHHGFDGTSPVRFRPGVPNGVSRDGVHVGGNPAARAAALREVDRFLKQYLEPQ